MSVHPQGDQQKMAPPPPYGGQPGGQPQMAQPPPMMPPQVVQQQWAPATQSIPGCPDGLEYLTQINSVTIKQQLELIEVFTSWESANKYKILNNQNQQIYFAAEESGMCMRQMCGSQRGFEIHITDNMNREVLRLRRDFKMCAGCCWCANTGCCAHEVAVEAPIGNVIGYVRQEYSGWSPNFSIKDTEGNIVLRLHGPCCVLGLPCCEDTFHIYSADDTQVVGKICKKTSMTELLSDANTFGADFPMDLDVKAKASILGAVFLLDFMYFEGKGGQLTSYT